MLQLNDQQSFLFNSKAVQQRLEERYTIDMIVEDDARGEKMVTIC